MSEMPPAATTSVTFLNPEGFRLFGILHEPGSPTVREEAILLLSPGVKMRVAPHRLYNKLASHFTSLGYRVLRFDFHGLGDAEGEAPERRLADLYGATQTGRYVPDTLAAMDWMEQRFGCRRFIMAGLCGGAITGLLAAQRDPRIQGLIALSMPVILDGSGIDAGRYMTDAQLTATREAYVARLRIWELRNLKSWFRLFSFQSDYRQILRSLLRPFAAAFRSKPAESAAADADDNTNRLFAPAFLNMVANRRPILLVFAGADRLFWEYESKFAATHGATLSSYSEWFDLHVVNDANHIFSFPEWQQEAMSVCSRWLSERYSGFATPAVDRTVTP